MYPLFLCGFGKHQSQPFSHPPSSQSQNRGKEIWQGEEKEMKEERASSVTC